MPKMFDRAVPVKADMEFRATASGGTHFRGYAAVFNSDSEPMPFVEKIAPGAFTRSLGMSQNQTLVLNHDDALLLASRRTGRLQLSADSTGLLAEADLPDTSYASDLRSLDAVGEVWGMSFTFRAARGGEVWSADRMRRELTDVSLGHVTVLTGLQPAYPATSGTTSIRALASAIAADPEDVERVLDLIRLGQPLEPRDYQVLLALTVQLNPSPDECDEPDDDEAAAAEPGPMMMAESASASDSEPGGDLAPRSLADYKALLTGKGIL